MKNNILIILCILIIISCICILLKSGEYKENKLDKFFYDIDEICPELNNIVPYSSEILNETHRALNSKWQDWPETELYEKNGQWKIFPFYAFGIWETENCNNCPAIYNFLKQIPGLKLATLSKLTAGMKLKPHKGWASHSNHVIRCHYGLIVPENCYISVIEGNDQMITYHNKFKWLLFDDSKIHFAENKSNSDRVVLIVDVERPPHVKTGTSPVGDSKELLEIIEYFRNKYSR